MTDFMTVLAASQTHAAGKTARFLAGQQLAEGAFSRVLAARVEPALDELAFLPQELAAEPSLGVPLDDSGEGLAAPEEQKDAPMAWSPDAAQVFPLLPVQVQDTARPQALVRTGPLASGIDRAARPAASEPALGQELPGSSRTMAATEALAATVESTVSGLPATFERALDALPQTDTASVNAARQFGQFEQVLRPAEARLQVALEAPVRSQAFPAEFSEKIVWLAGRQSQSADISLNPPQLGNIEVRLSLSGGEAGAQFFSPHLAVRDAIEAALPRLREMLAQAGITLGDAQVQGEAFARRESGGANPAGNDLKANEDDSPTLPLAMTLRSGRGLVDLYA